MSYTCHSVLVLLFFTLVFLVSLAFHVDDLLESTLFESPIRIGNRGSIFPVVKVYVHLVIVKTGQASHLLAYVVVLRMVSDFDLEDLPINDVRCLLAHCR